MHKNIHSEKYYDIYYIHKHKGYTFHSTVTVQKLEIICMHIIWFLFVMPKVNNVQQFSA